MAAALCYQPSIPMLAPLAPAPEKAYDPTTFAARVGAYAGWLHEVRWGYYKGWSHGQVRRALVRKRWFEVALHVGHRTLVVRLQDNGMSGVGRAMIFDRTSGTARVFERPGAPLRTLVVGPCAGEGAHAFLRAEDGRIELTRPVGASAWHLDVQGPGITLDLGLDSRAAPRPSLVVGRALAPFEHRPGLTQRAPLLAVTGTATVGVERLDLHDAVAEVSYTNVFLPPFVRSRVLTAHGSLEGRPAALAITGGELLGSHGEATLFFDGAPYGGEPLALDDTFAVRGPQTELRFVAAASHRASESRMGGTVTHDSVWTAGELQGSVALPGGRTAPLRWPALAESHMLLR